MVRGRGDRIGELFMKERGLTSETNISRGDFDNHFFVYYVLPSLWQNCIKRHQYYNRI